MALHAYSEAMTAIDKIAQAKSRQCSEDLAADILDKIKLLLDCRQAFQIDVGPRSIYLDYFVAFFNKGPNDLGRYSTSMDFSIVCHN